MALIRFVSLILLFNLLLLMFNHGYGEKEMTDQTKSHESKCHQQENKQLKTQENNLLQMKHSVDDDDDDDDQDHQVTTHHHNHMHEHAMPQANDRQMDFTEQLFFTIDDLHVGKTASFDLLTIDYSSLPPMLSKEEADSIPFSTEQLPNILRLLSISQDSPEAREMKATLQQCESKLMIKGETRFCVTSLESMRDSIQAVFGQETSIKPLITNRFNHQQKYTFQQVKEVKTSKTAACHSMRYPYGVFFCHRLESTKIFEILLSGEDGEKATSFFTCHMDTSGWDPDHQSFRVLGIKVGTSPVCHFVYPFPTGLVWVEALDAK